MPVFNGQPVDQGVTNPQFVDRTVDDTKVGKLNLHDPSSANVDDIQGTVNHLKGTTGATQTADGTTYSSQKVVTDGDNHQAAIGKLDARFHETTGHTHDGTAGNGPKLTSSDFTGVPLQGFYVQASDLSSVTGSSAAVNIPMSGQTASSGTTVEGVVVTAPDNKVILRDSVTDAEFIDGTGNIVYGRLTYNSGTATWTLAFYSEIAGTETAYTFASSTNIRWYYQKLFNPLSDAPTYSTAAKTATSLKGVRSLRSGSGGTKRSGDIALIAGTNTGITDNGDGTFTLTASLGGTSNTGWDAVVGTAAQVTAGQATHSSIQAAHDAISAGGEILLLSVTDAENLNISKQCTIVGKGYGSYINGDVTFASGADCSLLHKVRIGGNITVNTGVSNVMFVDSWIASSSVVTDNGTSSYIRITQQ
jgi:hypothetical protein